MRFKLSLLVALACAAVLALAGPAAAQNPTQNAYEPSTCTACTATTSGTGSGTLPFTGIDVGLLAVVGVSLAGVGLVMRRRLGSHTD